MRKFCMHKDFHITWSSTLKTEYTYFIEMLANFKKMKSYLALSLLCCIYQLGAQNTAPYAHNTYEKIGYIKADSSMDEANFEVCNERYIQEYYQVNPTYKEGVISIRHFFNQRIDSLNQYADADGVIVVRFVINCFGITGRYRARFFDENYIAQQKNEQLQNALKNAIIDMGRWLPGSYKGDFYDSYQHIKFRIKNKQLVDVFL